MSEAPWSVPDLPVIGVSPVMRLVYEGHDTASLWNGLVARTSANPADASAWMDLSVLMQATGRREQALEIQSAAIALNPVYRRIFGDGKGPKVAVLVTPGDMMANTPVDFLMEGSNAVLFYVYLDADTPIMPDLPHVDAAFLAIGPSSANRPVLANVERLLAAWQGPRVVNGRPTRIDALTRDGVAAMLAGVPSILAPATHRVARPMMLDLAAGKASLRDLAPAASWPLVIRPAETHAGEGMGRLEETGDLAAYLARETTQDYFLSPFVDYSGADGLYRKQRVVFIDGRPYASHMATSDHWIVHYLSADMLARPERRREEQAWMETFDTSFARRHAEAFSGLCDAIDLDYFGIDCAEMPDGRLLVFEADVAMIVHDMDSQAVFPYKKPAMRKLFAAFQAALAEYQARN